MRRHDHLKDLFTNFFAFDHSPRPTKNAPKNIVEARERLCAGGTWQGAAGPTWLKEGTCANLCANEKASPTPLWT